MMTWHPPCERVHFAQEWNEFHHLLTMEALGGDQRWRDRFLAQVTVTHLHAISLASHMHAISLASHMHAISSPR